MQNMALYVKHIIGHCIIDVAKKSVEISKSATVRIRITNFLKVMIQLSSELFTVN